MFRILVVEDDNELRGLFCRVLEKNGYEALEAADGQQALDVLDRQYIDLIISDIMMPVILVLGSISRISSLSTIRQPSTSLAFAWASRFSRVLRSSSEKPRTSAPGWP